MPTTTVISPPGSTISSSSNNNNIRKQLRAGAEVPAIHSMRTAMLQDLQHQMHEQWQRTHTHRRCSTTSYYKLQKVCVCTAQHGTRSQSIQLHHKAVILTLTLHTSGEEACAQERAHAPTSPESAVSERCGTESSDRTREAAARERATASSHPRAAARTCSSSCQCRWLLGTSQPSVTSELGACSRQLTPPPAFVCASDL